MAKHLKIISQIRQCNTYAGLGVEDMLYGKGGTRKRYFSF